MTHALPRQLARRQHDLRCLARCLLLAGVAAGAALPAAAAAVDEEFAAAMQLYHVDHYDAAFAKLTALADGGHEESARITLLMLRHGPRLYRAQWSATRDKVESWLDLASRRQKILVAGGSD